MFPVSTRLDVVTRAGLIPVMRQLLAGGVPGIVLESPSPQANLDVPGQELELLRAPIVGAIAPFDHAGDAGPANLASADAGTRARAVQAVLRMVPVLAAARIRRLIVVSGEAGLPGEAAARDQLSVAGADHRSIARTFREKSRRERERHAGVLCRLVFDLMRRLEGLTLHLMPGPSVLDFLDVEAAGWVLDDLGGAGLKLAIDSGNCWAAETYGGPSIETWFEVHAGRLGFLFVSDHDSHGSGEVLPGLGCGNLAQLRDVIGKSLPRALRPSRGASVDETLASVGEAARHLGPVGDVSGW